MDEQLREIKEKDTHNTQMAANPVTANPFNVSNGQPVTAVQPNPFQTNGNHQMLWPSDQTTDLFGNGLNGSQQSMYHPFNNGNNIFNGNGNAQQYQNKLAGHNAFNGSITIPNGFPQQQHQQPNPFAVGVQFTFSTSAKINSFLVSIISGTSIKCNNKSISMNLVDRSKTIQEQQMDQWARKNKWNQCKEKSLSKFSFECPNITIYH